MLRVIICLSLAFVIIGCVQPQDRIVTNSPYSISQKSIATQITAKSTPQNKPNNIIQSSVPIKRAHFNGIITLTAQQHTIQLCNNDEIFDLKPNKQLLHQLQKTQQRQVFIEFEGQINQSIKNKNAIVTIDQLHYLSRQTQHNCSPSPLQPLFEIRGMEPDWYGNAKESKLTFTIKNIISHWTIKRSVVTKGTSAFVEAQNSDGTQFNISFSGNGCTDNNNNYWQYAVKIHLKNKQIKGCGKYPNKQADNRSWLGNYNYKNRNLTIELKLKDNHQAKITYSYNNGNQLTETGYWHLFGSSGLKLLLTKRQGNKTNVVFHFRRDGIKLLANQQWRNNQKYNFNGDVLTLERMQNNIASFNEEPNSIAPRHFKAQTIASPNVSTSAINDAVKRYFSMHKTPFNNTKYLFSEYDLNGNGRKDLLVMLDWCQVDGCVLLIFKNQPNRYKFISRITQIQTPIQISRTQQHQWQSLLIKNNQKWRKLDFDGISYPAVSHLGTSPNESDFTQVKLFTNPLMPGWGITIK